METLTFDSDDLDRTEEFLSHAYAKMRIGNGTPDSSRARLHRTAIDSVSVDELDLDFDMSYAVTPLGRICLCVVHEGTIEDHVYQGVSDSFGPGDVVSFAPPELSYAGRIHAARYNITMLDPELLSQVAARCWTAVETTSGSSATAESDRTCSCTWRMVARSRSAAADVCGRCPVSRTGSVRRGSAVAATWVSSSGSSMVML